MPVVPARAMTRGSAGKNAAKTSDRNSITRANKRSGSAVNVSDALQAASARPAPVPVRTRRATSAW